MADPEKRTDGQNKLLSKNAAQVTALVRELAGEDERTKLTESQRELDDAKASYPAPLARGYIWYEEGPTASAGHVFRRGDPRSPAEEVDPGVPAVLVDQPPPPPVPTEQSTGRRLQLARWLTRADHPLTERVLVNRLWQHHFGDGIVATESDFGVMGAPPTNQPLLDWLASELVAGGWRMKRMHRLIVLSQTYQMASTGDGDAERIDPTGALLWRFPPHRLEAEALRDTVLAVQRSTEPRTVRPRRLSEDFARGARNSVASRRWFGASRRRHRPRGGACTCF